VLPPGRFRFLTSRFWTGSLPLRKTIGMVGAAARATRAGWAPPGVVITTTWRRPQIGGQSWQPVPVVFRPVGIRLPMFLHPVTHLSDHGYPADAQQTAERAHMAAEID